MENEESDIESRISSIIGWRDMDEFVAEAEVIESLLGNADQEIRDFLGTPEHIIDGLLPQCLGKKIDARLSSYCAIRALRELEKSDASAIHAGNWIAAAEKCSEAETRDYFTVRVKNSRVASNPRKDRLQELIEKFVLANPSASWKEILKEISKDASGAIQCVKDEKIEWKTPAGELKSTKISGLKDRVNRAKKSISR